MASQFDAAREEAPRRNIHHTPAAMRDRFDRQLDGLGVIRLAIRDRAIVDDTCLRTSVRWFRCACGPTKTQHSESHTL